MPSKPMILSQKQHSNQFTINFGKFGSTPGTIVGNGLGVVGGPAPHGGSAASNNQPSI